jgi:hypothetical protein
VPKIKRPKVIITPVASRYQAFNERIIEFSGPQTATGMPSGGLISFRTYDDHVVVELYRTDNVRVIYTPPREEPPALHEVVTALVGTLDSASPKELRGARTQLNMVAQDLGYPATQRRIAAALSAALREVK